MCAPATAALLIAALAALPSRGTDADGTSRTSNETSQETQPTINILYQMLHTSADLHNQSKLLDFNNNSSINLNSINFQDSLYSTVPIDKDQECCQIDDDRGVNLSKEGAKFVHTMNVDNDRKRTRKRRVVNVLRTDENVTRSYGRGKEATTVIPVVRSPVSRERKRKPGEPGSSSPLLNYIFDAYSQVHQHGDRRPGNNIYAAAAPEVEALVGSTAHLDCKVDALHDKLVSWVRRKNEDPMELITTGTQLYTADERYSARFIPPDIWRLEVKQVRPSDAAHYDCQLSAHPPRTARVTLTVPEVSVRIVDGAGAEVSEQVCEVGSTVALRCEVRGLRMEGGPTLLWYRREVLLNDDTTRGGISVRTEFGANGASSVLGVARVRGDDAGRYTCRVARAPVPAPADAHVILHIIKGESLAELHQGGTAGTLASRNVIAVILALWPVYTYRYIV